MIYDACATAIRSFCRRRPFQPFLVELHSGDRLPVTHPEALAWRDQVLYYQSPRRKQRLFDSTSVCQVLDTPE